MPPVVSKTAAIRSGSGEQAAGGPLTWCGLEAVRSSLRERPVLELKRRRAAAVGAWRDLARPVDERRPLDVARVLRQRQTLEALAQPVGRRRFRRAYAAEVDGACRGRPCGAATGGGQHCHDCQRCKRCGRRRLHAFQLPRQGDTDTADRTRSPAGTARGIFHGHPSVPPAAEVRSAKVGGSGSCSGSGTGRRLG